MLFSVVVDSLFLFFVCVWPLFCNEVRSVLPSFACLRLCSAYLN